MGSVNRQGTTVTNLLRDITDHFAQRGDPVDLRTLLADALNAAARDAYAAGVDHGLEDAECYLPHVDRTGAADQRAVDALDRMHAAVHDPLPVRACRHDDCRTLHAAITSGACLV